MLPQAAARVKPPRVFAPDRFVSSVLPWQDPWTFLEKLSSEDPLIFLDSASASKGRAPRRSFLVWDPWLWVKGSRRTLSIRRGKTGPWEVSRTSSPYEAFSALYRGIQKNCSFPEAVGAYGVFHYETAEFFEQLPANAGSGKNDRFEFIFPRQILVFDHSSRKVTWLSAGREQYPVPREQYPVPGTVTNLKAQFSKKQFENIVKRAKEYIRAGDIYQANLSQDFTFRFSGNPIQVYKKLRILNPSPFSSFLRLGGKTILSSSPELLLKKEGRRALTRPIAGTAPRGKTAKESRALARALLLSPKERAEHLMLLDLERNDLGRVSEFGSVRVEEKMVLEHYSHVIHIVSQVAGKLRAGKDALDLIRALFPGGTITGCPKIRSMEIIQELEQKPRGFYTGSLGFLGFSGDAVFNIIIRTIVLRQAGATLPKRKVAPYWEGSLRVGAGIVADSDPAQEYWETIQKGKALFKALGIGTASIGTVLVDQNRPCQGTSVPKKRCRTTSKSQL